MSCYEILGIPSDADIHSIHMAFDGIPAAAKTNDVFRAYMLALELNAYSSYSYDAPINPVRYVREYENFSNSYNAIKDLTCFVPTNDGDTD